MQLSFAARGRERPTISVDLQPPVGGVALLPVLSPPDRGRTLIRYDAVTLGNPRGADAATPLRWAATPRWIPARAGGRDRM